MKFRAFMQPYFDSVGLMIVETNELGKVSSYAKPVLIEMVERKPSDFVLTGGPTFDLPMQSAIGLMNALWEAGVRPTDFKHPSGEITRMEAHIADLRKIAFGRTDAAGSGE